MKTLQVGRFIDRQANGLGVIEDLTFEKLIELGSKKLAKLHWMTPEQTETLVKLLQGLTDGTRSGESSGQEEAVPSLGLSEPLPFDPQTDELPDDEFVEEVDGIPVFSSAEAEIRLRDVNAKLSQHVRFDEVARKHLGNFWKQTWTRAPFEEAMTIRQIVEFDVGTLLKKRTMSFRKVTMIVFALQMALDTIEGAPAETHAPAHGIPLRVVPSPTAAESGELLKPAKKPSVWTTSIVRGGTAARAAVCLFERECDHAQVCSDPAWRWVAEIPTVLTADEFLMVLDWMEHSYRGNRLPDSALEAARSKLEKFFDKHPVAVLALIRSAIASAGVPIAVVASSLGESALVSPTREMAAFLVLFSLKAEPVHLLDESLPGFWTSRPATIHAIAEAILQKLPLTDPELEHLLGELLLPDLIKPLGALLRSRLDLIEGRWTLVSR